MTGPYTCRQMSAEIRAGDVGTGRFDSVYAEAKAALGYAANTLRALTEQYREAYHADLASWHADHDELDSAELGDSRRRPGRPCRARCAHASRAGCDARSRSGPASWANGRPSCPDWSWRCAAWSARGSSWSAGTPACRATCPRPTSRMTSRCGSWRRARPSASAWPRRCTTARRRRS